MRTLYSILIYIVQGLLPVVALFTKKMKRFVTGRKAVHRHLASLDPTVPTIWLHAASLGEYEQGVPVIEEIQKAYPRYQWLITFFSPSGYEVKKNNAFAKATTYLPLDTPKNARLFVQRVQPSLAIFVKYEFWPNYLKVLRSQNIPTLLLSGVFRTSQPFFKPYGRWMTHYLKAFHHFFVQREESKTIAEKLGFKNVTVSGDTRFDRVSRQIEMDNTLDFVADFRQNSLCLVCGSTWPEGERFIVNLVNQNPGIAKVIIAPHEIHRDKITALKNSFKEAKVIAYSEIGGSDISAYDVLIVDTIGLLSKIYSYADIAYVGGAVGNTGLHNILEPATFGIPIITGVHLDKFPEAQILRQLAGLYTAKDAMEFKEIVIKLLLDASFRKQTGMIAGHYINSNTGATRCVMEFIKASGALT